MTKTLFELLEALPDEAVLSVSKDAMLHAPVVESADEVEFGGVFVAREGRSVDGHNYIAQAIANGAAAVIGSKPLRDIGVPYAQLSDPQAALGWLAAAYHDHPSRDLVMVGVTGTDGKTTTSTLLHSILKLATSGNAGYISTLAADLGGVTTDTGLHVTTPSAPAVQRYLAEMLANGMTHCVLEMTSHGLAQGRLNGVDLDAAVLTNVTHEHLDYHGTFQAYRDAKGTMFDLLARSQRKAGVRVAKPLEGEAPEYTIPKIAVVNADDPNAAYFAAKPADLIARYSIDQASDYQATHIRYEPGKTFFRVGDEAYFTPLVGQFNIYNCLAAIATARSLGVNLATTQTGLAQVRAVSGRMERIDAGQNFTAIVDFAHTPNALKMALQAARTLLPADRRLIVVFGSAGLRDVAKRRLMAETAAQYADFSILTAEDPRTESLDAILAMMADGCRAQGGIEGQTFVRIPDRGEALYRACQMAQPGDLVLACGKGHEQSMCFGTIEYPWDDREALRSALGGAPLRTLPTAG
ncbi:MAG: UDP-N-acetylmuramoyl-L-alanyl-D-glutamate--2,6-diaminopimelate ligase [Armatimonadetes bacterium]|nr:UDP-N-acetylmuramoyl-L-alanyl-D-glutamate--2,6-diaminopimelate ligase [Anaerolineae bacterium]